MTRLLPVLLAVLVCCVCASEATSYVAQVRIYVDAIGVTKWKKLLGTTEDVDVKLAAVVLFTEMNAIYATLKPSVDIQLQLKDLVLMDENVFESTTVAQGYAPTKFNQFTSKTYKKGDYDLAMLLTGADLQSTYKAYGASYPAGVCTKTATGVSEVFNLDLLPIMLSHEIAHVLGAVHDDQAPLCQPTWWARGDIMNTVTYPKSSHRFTFSYCSAVYIYNKVTTLDGMGDSCLTDETEIPDVDLQGKSPDESCKLLYGHRFTLNRGKYDVYGDKFCANLYCVGRIDKKFSFRTHEMPKGMPCGQNKRCSNKKCVAVSDGIATMPDACPWGDQDLSSWGYTKMCKDKDCDAKKGNWAKYCCHTCQASIDFGK